MLFLFLFRVCSLLLLFFSVFCVTLFHVVIQFVCRRLSFRLLRLLVLPLLRLSNHQTVRSVSLSPPAGRVRLRPSHHDVHQGVAASALRHQSRTTRWRWDARLVVVSSRQANISQCGSLCLFQGNLCTDCLCSTFCLPCVWCQMATEMKKQKLPTMQWHHAPVMMSSAWSHCSRPAVVAQLRTRTNQYSSVFTVFISYLFLTNQFLFCCSSVYSI